MASSSWPAAGLHGGQPCDVQDDNAAKENSVQSLSIRIDLDLWLLEQFFPPWCNSRNVTRTLTACVGTAGSEWTWEHGEDDDGYLCLC